MSTDAHFLIKFKFLVGVRWGGWGGAVLITSLWTFFYMMISALLAICFQSTM